MRVDVSFKNLDESEFLQNVIDKDLEKDQALYESILSNILAREEQPSPAVEAENVILPKQMPAEPPPSREPTPYEVLHGAITGNHKRSFYNEDNALRVRYFVEDLEGANGLTPEQLKLLTNSFSHFNLHEYLRHDENRPEDAVIRTFFDDVTLKYLRHGKIPTKDELDKLYEGVKQGK